MMKFCVVFLGLFALCGAHSWMSCPQSFVPRPGRGGETGGPCERGSMGGSTTLKAGDRLKVGWTSNNHARGWVRLALVPTGQHTVYEHFEQNVLKFVCYGHDESNYGASKYGDCSHPCNARKGCEYQSNKYDGNRYDTTIKIPYNLRDGTYVLQYMAAMSAHYDFYYSCASLRVSGGNPSLSCEQTGPIPIAYGCLDGLGTKFEKYTVNTKMGNFCFAEDGLGDQDADMSKVPVNVDCDPRITCELSIDPKGCSAVDNMMNITSASNPKQICKGEVVPPPEPTCEDGIRNQGEEMVDCGGPAGCASCTEKATEPPDGRIHTAMEYSEVVNLFLGRIDVKMEVRIVKKANNWRFTIQLTEPVDFTAFWNCKLISVNQYKTIWKFGPDTWNKRVKKNQIVSCGFIGQIINPDGETPRTVTKTFEKYGR